MNFEDREGGEGNRLAIEGLLSLEIGVRGQIERKEREVWRRKRDSRWKRVGGGRERVNVV